MTRLVERLEHVKEVAVLTQETWNATTQNQTNRIVKVLAGITFVLTVPMLIGTYFGMNVRGIPEHWGFWPIVVFSTLLTVPLYFIAKKSDWI
jgi:magnesium transporter